MIKLNPVTAPMITGSMILPDEIPPVAISSGIITGSSISIEFVMISIV